MNKYTDGELARFNQELKPFKDTKGHLTIQAEEDFLIAKGVMVRDGNYISIKNIYKKDGYRDLRKKLDEWVEWQGKQKEIKNLENLA
jgi:hypothetical protein